MTVSDEMFGAYVECALWSSLDISRDDEGNLITSTDWDGNNAHLDRTYSMENCSPALLARMRADLESFIKDNYNPCHEFAGVYGWTQVAHSFWLSREGHGAGFFDFDGTSDKRMNAIARELQSAAKLSGEFSDEFSPDGDTLRLSTEPHSN